MESGYLVHYGIPKRSGRYPYGSGERPYQDLAGGRVSRKNNKNNNLNKNKINNKKEINSKEPDTKGIKLTDQQKKYIKTGATIAAAILVSYGGYKISTSPKFRNMVYKGMQATSHKNNKIDFDAEPKIVDKFGNPITGEALQRLIDKGLI